MSLIDAGAMAICNELGWPLDTGARRTSNGLVVRRAVWKVAAERLPIRTIAGMGILGERWSTCSIRRTISDGVAPDPAVFRAMEVARRAMFPRSTRPPSKPAKGPTLAEVERDYMAELWERLGTVNAVAEEAGLSRHAAARLLAKHGIRDKEPRLPVDGDSPTVPS